MKYNSSMVFRRIGSECVVVPTGKNVDAVRSVFTLNDSAAFILEKIKEGADRNKILEDIRENYELDSIDNVEEWIDGLIREFRAYNIVV